MREDKIALRQMYDCHIGRVTRNEGLWRQKIFSPRFWDFRSLCSRDVSIYCVGESWCFDFRSGCFLVTFKSQSKKFKLIQKFYVPRALRFSCQVIAG